MSKRQFVLMACVVLGVLGGATGWRVWVLLRPTPLPPVNVALSEPLKPGPCVVNVEYMFPTQNVADLFMDADTVLWVGLQTSRTDRMDLGQGNDFTIYHFTAWESAKGAVDRKDTARIARMGGRNVGSPTFGVQASVNSLSYSYGGSQKQTPIGCVRHAIVITCSSAS